MNRCISKSMTRQLTRQAIGAGQQDLCMVVAAGPFSSKTDVLFEPLQALLEHCTACPPHVLLLLGPFLDAEHPLVQAGTLQDSFQHIFTRQVHSFDCPFAVTRYLQCRLCFLVSCLWQPCILCRLACMVYLLQQSAAEPAFPMGCACTVQVTALLLWLVACMSLATSFISKANACLWHVELFRVCQRSTSAVTTAV